MKIFFGIFQKHLALLLVASFENKRGTDEISLGSQRIHAQDNVIRFFETGLDPIGELEILEILGQLKKHQAHQTMK